MTRLTGLIALALLLTACGAPATETPVPTQPANWCRVTALDPWRIYATEKAATCLFQTFASGAVVAPPTPNRQKGD